VLIECCSKLLH